MKRGRIIVLGLAALWLGTVLVYVGVRPRLKASKDLLLAARQGDQAKVKDLLARGANVNTRNVRGQSALWQAAYGGHADIARLLLEKGADPNARDENDMTPLHWAAAAGHVETVRALLEKGADPNARSRFGDPPIRYARNAPRLDSREEIIRLLIKAGASRKDLK